MHRITNESGDKQDTKGTAFVVYEDIYDAKNAVDHLSGFNVCGRYLIVLYYQRARMQKSVDNAAKRKEIDEMKAKFGIDKTEETPAAGPNSGRAKQPISNQ